eukprot:m.796885 g.796885  ORF g.796885 m.796885 type:complete len:404 (-) comp59248_c0_seq1:75-1286(-)
MQGSLAREERSRSSSPTAFSAATADAKQTWRSRGSRTSFASSELGRRVADQRSSAPTIQADLWTEGISEQHIRASQGDYPPPPSTSQSRRTSKFDLGPPPVEQKHSSRSPSRRTSTDFSLPGGRPNQGPSPPRVASPIAIGTPSELQPGPKPPGSPRSLRKSSSPLTRDATLNPRSPVGRVRSMDANSQDAAARFSADLLESDQENGPDFMSPPSGIPGAEEASSGLFSRGDSRKTLVSTSLDYDAFVFSTREQRQRAPTSGWWKRTGIFDRKNQRVTRMLFAERRAHLTASVDDDQISRSDSDERRLDADNEESDGHLDTSDSDFPTRGRPMRRSRSWNPSYSLDSEPIVFKVKSPSEQLVQTGGAPQDPAPMAAVVGHLMLLCAVVVLVLAALLAVLVPDE